MTARTLRPWRRRAIAAVLTGATALALVACSGIPTSGPVQKGDAEVSLPSDIVPLAEGPRPGATPVDIVESFLNQQFAGFGDQFVTARQYLAGDSRSGWKPLDKVVVAGQLSFQLVGSSEVTVDMPVLGRIDADGRYTEAATGAHETMTFELVQDDAGEWRISDLPDGLVLSQPDVVQLFQPTSLYFLSPDGTYLVPETRWLPERNLSTSIVRGLLAGPSPWLRGAVRTAVPEGVQLQPETVPLDDQGVALVQLSAARTTAVLDADRPLLFAQIQTSLSQVPGVGSVRVEVGGAALEGGTATLQRAGPTGGSVELLQGGRIVRLDGDKLVPVPGVGALDGLDARSPARSEDGSVRVMLSGRDTLVTVPTDGAPAQTLVTGSSLAAPSVDRFGWAWTGDAAGELLAARAGADAARLRPDWLQGRAVDAVRVAADGARIAVVSTGPDGVTVDVAAVMRDESGVPQQVGEPLRVGTTLVEASSVVWLDEAELGVVGRSTGKTTLHQVPLSGPTETTPEVGEIDGVAGGKVTYVTTDDGALLRLVNTTWVRVPGVEGATDPSYAG